MAVPYAECSNVANPGSCRGAHDICAAAPSKAQGDTREGFLEEETFKRKSGRRWENGINEELGVRMWVGEGFLSQ